MKYSNKSLKVFLILTIFIYSFSGMGHWLYARQTNLRLQTRLQELYQSSDRAMIGEQNFDQTETDEYPKEIMEDLTKSSPLPGDATVEKELKNKTVLGKYHSLLEFNADVMGWIAVAGTNIDYPVLQSEDNLYYLQHTIEKKEAKAGSIFMDFRNSGDGNDRNTILYGHNMRDGTMFRKLYQYKSQSFYKAHPVISFNTLYEDITWEIFSVYVTDPSFYYIKTEFVSDIDYIAFLQDIQSQSLYDTGVTLSAKDRILTLSTCSYEEEDFRLVVHAKRRIIQSD